MDTFSDTKEVQTKLSPVTKLIYGTGRGVETLTFEAISIFYLYFLTDIVHLSPVTAALVLLFPRLWEGICNPIMGAISDRTHSRFGRRKPYMIGSALPIAVFFMLMWIPINLGTQTYTAVFYGLMFFVFATAEAAFLVPYYSIGIEMTTDFDERTSVTTYRELVGMIFGLIAATVPSLLVHSFANAKTGYMVMGAVLAVACGLIVLFVGLNSKERTVVETEKPVYSLKEMLKPIAQNKQFLHVTVIYFMAKFAYMAVESFQVYFYTYWVGKPSLLPAFLLTSCVAWVIGTPFFKKVLEKKGKRFTYILSASFWIVFSLFYLVVPRNAPIYVFFIMQFFGGLGWGYCHVIPPSMLADTTDLDELITGQRREGLMYGTWGLFGLIGGAIAMTPIMYILQKSGYVANSVQPQSALNAIRGIMALGASIPMSIGIIATLRYNITKKRHAEIRAKIEDMYKAKRAADAVERQDL